ncbi:Ribosomal protein S18 acetylase RimI [Anaerovirgula multivorans]|uniref:Ribosomal protein S18 acetylase RimI n=1 Tax=Anaerovirgula multivorans TaxID=312168 RepID=A0A239KIU5_9FIRM|nr:GNAT family N-acetyltransferase [Anaerovirgula multivorans]SNT17054.1 Ribosomal protein S18 acetylase RimI [Anaerovirgula multivorans]
MKVLYRRVEGGDIEEILMLFNKLKIESAEVTFADVVNKREIEEWLMNTNYYLYIAEVNKKIISIFRGVRGIAEKNHCILLTIATDPQYRSLGITKNLILYSLKDIKERERNIVLARAYVYNNNNKSLNTLMSCGFTVSGSVYQHHYDKKTGLYIDDIILHKILQ